MAWYGGSNAKWYHVMVLPIRLSHAMFFLCQVNSLQHMGQHVWPIIAPHVGQHVWPIVAYHMGQHVWPIVAPHRGWHVHPCVLTRVWHLYNDSHKHWGPLRLQVDTGEWGLNHTRIQNKRKYSRVLTTPCYYSRLRMLLQREKLC